MFFYKLYSLIKHLLHLHSGTILKLDSIENGKSLEDTLILFTNTKTNKQLSQNLKKLHDDKNLLQLFDGKDACQIGYAYGRIIYFYGTSSK